MRFPWNSKQKGWGLGLALFVFASLLPAQSSTSAELLSFLTPEQWVSLDRSVESYQVWLSPRIQRAFQVYQEYVIELKRPVVDSLGLGLRLAEIESIRREAVIEIERITLSNRNSLKPDQLAKLDGLVYNQALAWLQYQNSCELWFESTDSAVDDYDRYGIFVYADRSIFCSKATLADYLELSPATRADFEERRKQLYTEWNQRTLEYKTLAQGALAARQASPLDPVELGRRAASVEQLYRGFVARRNEFINRRYADLTVPQKAKLQAVKDAARELSQVGVAECYALLLKPAPRILPPPSSEAMTRAALIRPPSDKLRRKASPPPRPGPNPLLPPPSPNRTSPLHHPHPVDRHRSHQRNLPKLGQHAVDSSLYGSVGARPRKTAIHPRPPRLRLSSR
ncbi:MAG: hypothetical protein NTV52_24700 [Acidobacteria bacterium]|nr:hypothetical protein [Acidobacteriota bacterium]